MAKLITLNESIANPLAPRILRTPGVGGYAARFIANHLNEAPGSIVNQWSSVGGTVPTTLQTLGGIAAATTTLGTSGGIQHVTSPGNSSAGGRLIGQHISTRPITLAAVVRMGVGREDFMGITGSTLTRSTDGIYQGKSGSSAYTATNTSNWAFVMFAQAADNSFIVRADYLEEPQPVGAAASATFGGLYFGATQAGDSADVREIIYWPRQLDSTERTAVHAYMKTRYPELL
jgi:hypothetical protein